MGWEVAKHGDVYKKAVALVAIKGTEKLTFTSTDTLEFQYGYNVWLWESATKVSDTQDAETINGQITVKGYDIQAAPAKG